MTPVYGCCMGLRSDILGCRYCLCGPCKDNLEEADGTRTRRGDRAMKEKLKDKTVECGAIPARHLRINLIREHDGNYFKQAVDETTKSYPRMCCGCLRPFVG
jgi:hypothetical protein